MLALLGRTISLMENLGFLWVVQTGFALELWDELKEPKSLEDLLLIHANWDKTLLDHWLEQACCHNLLVKEVAKDGPKDGAKNGAKDITRDGLTYKTTKLGKAVQTYRFHGLEALYREFVVHWNPGFAKLPQLITGEAERIPFAPEMSEELISKASLASEPFVWPYLKSKFHKNSWQRVLDIGCGEGLYLNKLLEYFPSLQGVGLEINPTVAERAQQNSQIWGERLKILCADALNMPPDIGTFDVCLLNNNIYYFSPEQRLRLLENIKQVLKPTGQIGILSALRKGENPSRVFRTHIPQNLMSFFLACHQGFQGLPTEDEIRELLAQAGFANISVTPLPFKISHYFFAEYTN